MIHLMVPDGYYSVISSRRSVLPIPSSTLHAIATLLTGSCARNLSAHQEGEKRATRLARAARCGAGDLRNVLP